MELICPDCRGELQLSERRTAHCPLHGGDYEVLFDREAESMARTAERAIPVEGKVCAEHPRQSAIADCATCGKALCGLCSFDVAGRHYCSDCAVSGAQTAPPPPPPAQATPYEPPTLFAPLDAKLNTYAAPPPRRSVPEGLMCSQHLESPAVAQCRACSSGVCATCDFEMPGGVHFCPACIDNAGSEEISPKRKKMAIAATAIAVYVTLMYVFMLTGTLYRAMGSPKEVQVFGCFILLIVYGPSIVGTALASGAFHRRLRNSAMIWTALVWNIVIISVLGLQLLIGMMLRS